jgi:hypothetical protein
VAVIVRGVVTLVSTATPYTVSGSDSAWCGHSGLHMDRVPTRTWKIMKMMKNMGFHDFVSKPGKNMEFLTFCYQNPEFGHLTF